MQYSEVINNHYINKEILSLQQYKPVSKDILLVVKDQYEYVKNCIESIYQNTKDFNLYIWDNGSRVETANYLKSLNTNLNRVERNEGFIMPNNYLAAMGKAPYLILLNSDTIVKPCWDSAMISWLQTHEKVAQVGYMGMNLTKFTESQGMLVPQVDVSFGYDIDFVSAWCTCISRETYNKFGLFDEEHLKVAYSEDSDFSFRLQEAGYEIYALSLRLVDHYGNQTIKQLILEEGEEKFRTTSQRNLNYLKARWGDFLRKKYG